MSRPIPIEIIPSHIHLSEAHHRILFGERHLGTVYQELSQAGQFVYAETVDVVGKDGASIQLHVLGPSRRNTQVELTPTESKMLGISAPIAVSGDLSQAGDCVLQTEHGSLDVSGSVIVPQKHIHLSESEAELLHLLHGESVRIEVVGDESCVIDSVTVRVHPTYRARFHIHADDARLLWLGSNAHVRIREIHH